MEATTVRDNAKSLPGYKGIPIFGTIREFRRDPLLFLERGWHTYGDHFTTNLGPRTLHVISNPQLAQEVLTKRKHVLRRSNRFEGGTPLTYILGLSLITTDGDSWLAKRRMMQPVFHRSNIAAMADKMQSAGEAMLARWVQIPAGKTIEFTNEMKLVTLDIINRTMFSTNVLPEVDQVGSVVDQALEFINSRVGNPFALPARWTIVPSHKKFWEERAKLDEYLFRMIGERRLGMTNDERKGDLLEMLIEAQDADTGEMMNDEQIRHEVAGIYGAGHETTALALTWAWHMLNKYPEVLAKVRAEVDALGHDVQADDLPNLPYTLAVLEETMRLFPPVPMTVRAAFEPSEVGGIPIPKGHLVAIAIRNIHRHPEYWQNPTEFKPERFLPENKASLNRNAYMPFLSGPHMCIGNHFALIEGQLLLAMMVQKYDVKETPMQSDEGKFAITLRPKNGLPVMITSRSL
ncbi:MAG TPA: cytochrome P450 [Anaerolineales bacterium]|nr:cytochrome P450 [Anaerolineales bacterium]